MASSSIMVRANPIAMPRNHRQLYGRTSTSALILSVTEP